MKDDTLELANKLFRRIKYIEKEIDSLEKRDFTENWITVKTASEYADYGRKFYINLNSFLNDKICRIVLAEKKKTLKRLNKKYNKL